MGFSPYRGLSWRVGDSLGAISSGITGGVPRMTMTVLGIKAGLVRSDRNGSVP